jgi:hypothetical protein
MIDELKRTELAELSLAVLMALLWVRLALNVLHDASQQIAPALSELQPTDTWSDSRYRDEANGVATALQTACRQAYSPIDSSVWEPPLHDAVITLRRAAEEMDLILAHGRTDLHEETRLLLLAAHGKLQGVATALSYAINPEIVRGNGMTLAVLFLNELAVSIR